MLRQDVQDHACGIDIVRQRLGTRGFNCFDPIGKHSAENVDHLPIADGLAFKLVLAHGGLALAVPIP